MFDKTVFDKKIFNTYNTSFVISFARGSHLFKNFLSTDFLINKLNHSQIWQNILLFNEQYLTFLYYIFKKQFVTLICMDEIIVTRIW